MKFDPKKKTLTFESSGRVCRGTPADMLSISFDGSLVDASAHGLLTQEDVTPAEKRELAAHAIASWEAWGKPFDWTVEPPTGGYAFELGDFIGTVGPMECHGSDDAAWWMAELLLVKKREIGGTAKSLVRVFATCCRSIDEAKKAVEAAIDAQAPTIR